MCRVCLNNEFVRVCVNNVNNFCQVCNVNLLISGYGKFNLFNGVCSKEQNLAAKLSSVLGFPVNKEIIALSILCMKYKREVEKFEKLFEGLCLFKEKALMTLKEQKELNKRGIPAERVRSLSASKQADMP